MTVSEYAELRGNEPDRAYRALFDEYCDYVYAVVYNKIGSLASREDIEECVSDVFAEVWFGFDNELAQSGDIKGYIGTVAKRRAINRFHSLKLRAGRSADDSESALGLARDATDLESETDQAEVRRIMLKSIEALGEPDSTIIIHKYYYGHSSMQIAKMLSMKPSAVRMRTKRAVAKLGELLKDAGITG